MAERRPLKSRDTRWANALASALVRGAATEGHGGVLDRIDSICFAAPIFLHLTRYFFT